jgi:hypothetical protein
MKRLLMLSALLCGILALNSCAVARDLVSIPGRAVQGVARTAGF